MENLKKLYVNFIVNNEKEGKCSICSTCKHFNGKSCSKGRSFGGFATKLSDCNEWEVCNG